MNAPVSVAAPPPLASTGWQLLLPPLAVGSLLLGAIFHREVLAAVQTWNASTAYNHCFLIIPIALYLLWDRRFDLVGIPIRPMPVAVLLGVPLAAAWLVTERLGIMEGRQLIAISFLEVLFLSVLGKQLWWAMAGPLLYLYFLAPFGEFLTPRLQDITTFFVRHGLEVLGIPAYIDGYVIEIPQGTFFVAEACAGLRFLIASIAFGCLYALMMYRSPLRRCIFILVSIIVPIFANGLRGIGIVYLGYLLGSAEAAAADHIIYGWLFFSAVTLLLLLLGLPFRQDELPTRSRSLSAPVQGSMRGALAMALGVAAMAALSPAVAAGLAMSAAIPAPSPQAIEVEPDCELHPLATAADVAFAVRTQLVTCGGTRMIMTWATFSPRSTAAPVMAARRRLVSRALTEGLAEDWLPSTGGVASTWRIMKSNDPAYITAVSIWVDGRPVRPGLAMRLRLALDSLNGSAYAPMVVTVTPDVDWDTGKPAELRSAEAELPTFLQRHPALVETIGALSRLR